MNIVYFDLETSGLERDRHEITQFAAVVVDGNGKEIDALNLLVRIDESKADPKALEVNHYDPERWAREAVSPADARRTISSLLRKHASIEHLAKSNGRPYSVAQLAGHNAAGFDGPFLQAWYKRAGDFLPADPRVLCTMQLMMWRAIRTGSRPPSFRLADCCREFGIELGADAHDALADVRATARLALELLR